MIKNDHMKEVENTLTLLTEEVDKDIIKDDIVNAKDRLNKALKSLVGIDIGTVDIFSFSSLEGFIAKEMHYNAEKFIAFGCIMKLYGLIREKEQDENNMIQYFEKSLESFYKAYNEDDELTSKYMNDALFVVSQLSNYEISLEVDRKIFKFYELGNKFDKAEDTLFYMLRKTNNEEVIILEGIKFYNRLKGIDSETLKLGNLPIEEVDDGISELERRLGL